MCNMNIQLPISISRLKEYLCAVLLFTILIFLICILLIYYSTNLAENYTDRHTTPVFQNIIGKQRLKQTKISYHCFVESRVTWQNASDHCENMGMNLVRFEKIEELEMFVEELTKMPILKNFHTAKDHKLIWISARLFEKDWYWEVKNPATSIFPVRLYSFLPETKENTNKDGDCEKVRCCAKLSINFDLPLETRLEDKVTLISTGCEDHQNLSEHFFCEHRE